MQSSDAMTSSVYVQQGYKLDFAKLDHFFQAINKQLFETQIQIKECVNEKMYKDEMQQRMELIRKVDGSLLDINMLKDLIYSESQPILGQLRENKVQLLRGEVENLKMNIRRMEMQQAEHLQVFSRLKKLEKQQLQLEDDFITYKNSDIFAGIRNELNDIKEEMIKKVSDDRRSLDRQFLVLESKIFQLETAFKGTTILDKFSQFEDRIKSLEERTEDIETTLKEAMEEMEDGDEEHKLDEETNLDLVPIGMTRPAFLDKKKQDINIGSQEPPKTVTREEIIAQLGGEEDEEEEEEEEDEIAELPPLPVCGEEEEIVPAATARAPRNSIIQKSKPTPKISLNAQPTIVEDHSSIPSPLSSHAPTPTTPKALTTTSRQHRAASVMISNRPSSPNSHIQSPVPIGAFKPAMSTSALVAPSSPTQGSSAPSPIGTLQKKKSSRKFSIFGGGSNVNVDSLKDKFVDAKLFQLWQQEAIHLRQDVSKMKLKFHAMESSSITRIFKKYTVTKERQALYSAFLKFKMNVHQKKVQAEQETAHMLKVFQARVFRFSDRRRIINALHRWKYNTDMTILGEQYRPWIKSKIQLWMEATHPDLGEYMNRWKKFTLYSFRALMLKSVPTSNKDDDEEDDFDESKNLD